MQISDITAEVRDINLDVKGIVTSQYLDIVVKPIVRGVGEWQVTLPGDHPMVPYLQTSGSGMIFSLYGQPYLSGPTNHPKEVKNAQNPDGTYTFTGVDDNIHLWHARAFPQPTNYDATTQTAANDVRTGNAETIMRQYVNVNIGPGSPIQRRPVGSFRNKITLATNANRGPSVQQSPRFQILGELLAEIGVLANLGFRLVQVGNTLEFRVLTLADRSDLVELSVANGSLSSETLEKAPPSITRAIVAGQGEGVARQFVTRTTAASVAAEAEWGLIIEEYIDQRNTNVTTELQQAGDKRLLESGFTAVAVKAVPSDDQTMRLVKDWDVGDTVGLIQNGARVKSMATQAVIVANSKGVIVGAAIGDVTGFNAQSVMGAQLQDLAGKVEDLQRAVGTVVSATTTTLGAVKLSTDAEAVSGLDPAKVLTPSNLGAGLYKVLPPRLAGNTGTNVTDWNSITESGWYASQPGASNAPVGGAYFLGRCVIYSDSNFGHQIASILTASGASDTWEYRRDKVGGVWTSWYRLRSSEAELDARYPAIGRVTNLETRESMVRLIPTSMAVTGGSGAFDSNPASLTYGRISFSGSSIVDANGLFSSSYLNYIILWYILSASADFGVSVRVRAGGVDDTSNYAGGYGEMPGGTGWVNTGSGTGEVRMGRSAAGGGSGRLELFGPAVASQATRMMAFSSDNSAYFTAGGARQGTAKAHDGIRFFGGTNMVGYFEAYGIRG